MGRDKEEEDQFIERERESSGSILKTIKALLLTIRLLWSISSTFYAHDYHMKVLFCQNPFAKAKT